jgi:hypothetical protein
VCEAEKVKVKPHSRLVVALEQERVYGCRDSGAIAEVDLLVTRIVARHAAKECPTREDR